MGMPITAQENVLRNEWGQLVMRIEQGKARWLENDLAITEYEGDNK